jgi:hypothetical protein
MGRHAGTFYEKPKTERVNRVSKYGRIILKYNAEKSVRAVRSI